MNKEEANKLISEKVTQAASLIKECEALAKDFKLAFDFEPSYGMGGTFEGHCENEYDSCMHYNEDFGWHPSSHSC